MKWMECGNGFINLDHVCNIIFEKDQINLFFVSGFSSFIRYEEGKDLDYYKKLYRDILSKC